MITAEEFFRQKLKETYPFRGEVSLHQVTLDAETAMRWGFEYAQLCAKELREVFEDDIESLETTEGDSVECIGIENLEGHIKRIFKQE